MMNLKMIGSPFLDITPVEEGIFCFNFIGEPGIAYPFVSSANLMDWQRYEMPFPLRTY